ncbi:STAS domain-containing protein [Mycolicibacterium arenosum]|uniref:STAS domain-containing protein n=1 Tax=Mycolicibacterium arenosum TaxID=2952157 RepID=A0ABT1LZB7_9MYCO|nr:STAS domain-containing protein [Mycolicibacterium sp. CAU 1645]MCP9272260.1 STAS domain-containing protein [Mycolicibacterium sp. CAU 1645]
MTDNVHGFRYGNPAQACDLAQMSALCRQLATVVSISGVLDDTNVARATEYATRYVLCEKPFVLDLGDVEEFSDSAIALLYAIDDASFDEGVEWAVVASPAVLDAMRHYGNPADFHTVDSVPDALHHFADATAARRRLLPMLAKTA